ncbi:MAG: cupin domain-containing protein [Deltaproteobacteria bacterium]|nr:cupin domain-containing protein [Deltaproteobacteria bacterium]
MHIAKWNDVAGKAVAEQGATGVMIRVLMGENVGAPNFTMRHFEVAPGGSTPYHTHAWEHEVYVLSGKGKVRRKGGEAEVASGSFVFVASEEEHSFVNAGDAPLTFLCLIPSAGVCLK